MKKTAVLLASLFLAASVWAQDAAAPQGDVGYAFGLLMGQSLTTTGLELNAEQVASGVRDSLTKGSTPRFDAATAEQIVRAALAVVQEKAAAEQAKAAAEKMEKEKAWMAEHGKKAWVTTTASGLQYEGLFMGPGKKPTATDTVKVNYVGTLVDGTEFDNSIKRGEPAVFALDQVIPAWTEGIQLMGVGDKFRFTIPSSLAYGAEGAGNGIIPPYATLIFEVELLSIEKPEASAEAPAAQ